MISYPLSGMPTSATDQAVLELILNESKKAQAPEMPESDFFELFSAQQILKDFRLSPEEIVAGLVSQLAEPEGGSDGGIDAIYLLVNGVLIRDTEQAQQITHKKDITVDLIIIQSTREKGVGLNRVLRLKDTSENIFSIDRDPDKFGEKLTDGLTEAIKCFREVHKVLITRHPKIEVHFYCACKGDPSETAGPVSAKGLELEKSVPAILSTITKCKFTVIGARDLINLYQAPQKTVLRLKCAHTLPQNSAGILALVDIADYYKFITNDKGELLDYLFEDNVRDYEGDVDVNEQIRATLQSTDDKAEFWWLNNGITILAQRATNPAKEITVDEPRIVNGLQTSREIFEHFKSITGGPSGPTGRHALVRIIASPDDALQDRIIKATNSQTKIPAQYLWASDQLQRDIEIAFRAEGMHYDRRKNSWRKHPELSFDKIIGSTELAQSVAAVVLQEPDHARARPSRYFKPEHYLKVFSPKHDIALYLKCAAIRRVSEAYIRANIKDKKDRNNLLFYFLMTLTCLHLKTQKPGPAKIAALELAKIQDATFKLALETVQKIYAAHGASDKAAKGTEILSAVKTDLTDRFAKPKKA